MAEIFHTQLSGSSPFPCISVAPRAGPGRRSGSCGCRARGTRHVLDRVGQPRAPRTCPKCAGRRASGRARRRRSPRAVRRTGTPRCRPPRRAGAIARSSRRAQQHRAAALGDPVDRDALGLGRPQHVVEHARTLDARDLDAERGAVRESARCSMPTPPSAAATCARAIVARSRARLRRVAAQDVEGRRAAVAEHRPGSPESVTRARPSAPTRYVSSDLPPPATLGFQASAWPTSSCVPGERRLDGRAPVRPRTRAGGRRSGRPGSARATRPGVRRSRRRHRTPSTWP